MHSINSHCSATNICIDQDRFMLEVIFKENKHPSSPGLIPYGMIYRIAWKTEVYNFVDETTEYENERDFMFEMNLN